MAYDEDLAMRIRELLADTASVREMAMFGGLGFLIHGNMAVAASSTGGLMVRVDPVDAESLIATRKAEPMVMRGRPMKGWLLIPADNVRTKRQLAPWVRRGMAFASSLPPKR